MTETIRLDVGLLLPDVEDVRDACVRRLLEHLNGRDGIVTAHVVDSTGADAAAPAEPVHSLVNGDPTSAILCLHYDPARISLSRVAALARSAGADLSAQYGHALLRFRSVSSEDRGRMLEEGLRAIPGVVSASVNFAAQTARVEYDRLVVQREAIVDALVQLDAAPVDPGRDAPTTGTWRSAIARLPEVTWSLVSGGLLALAWITERAAGTRSTVVILLYLCAYAFGAQDSVRHFVSDARRGRVHVGIDLLMVLAAIGAAFLGDWAEGGLLLFLFSLGHSLEHFALGRARGAIKALADLAPQEAVVLRDGRETRVPINQVNPGDLVVVKPGERVSVDGEVAEGESAVNQAPITGESIPVTKAKGEKVFAGSVNGEGALVVSVTAAVGDRTLDRVIKLVSDAETQKAPTQQFTDRFERIFVPSVLAGVVVLIVLAPALGLWDVKTAVYRGLAVLIASAPCALALGTPAAVLAGIGQAARRGVLIKGGAHLEMLATVTIIALDKTGTITEGNPGVTDVRPGPSVTEAELLSLAAGAERRSQHPLANAVIREAERRGLTIRDAASLQSVTGRGLRATVGDKVIEVGRALLFEDAGVTVPEAISADATDLEERGRTVVLVREVSPADPSDRNARWLGVIGIADQPRAAAAQAITALRRAGIRHVVMLTGDNEGVARAVAGSVGIDEVRANLLPEDKVAAVKELSARGSVVMVGDGVNDAAALAHAAVGVAMGGAGTAAALETADVALMGDDLGRLSFAIGLSRRARATIRQNVAISLTVIGLLVTASLFGIAGIGWAVVVHEGSTLVVIVNALRLLAYGGPGTETEE